MLNGGSLPPLNVYHEPIWINQQIEPNLQFDHKPSLELPKSKIIHKIEEPSRNDNVNINQRIEIGNFVFL